MEAIMASSKVALSASFIFATLVAATAASPEQSPLNFRDDFTGTSLRPEWTVQAPDPDRMALTDGDYVMIITNPAGSNKLIYEGELPKNYEIAIKLIAELNRNEYSVNVAYLGIQRRENNVAVYVQGDGRVRLSKTLKGEVSTLESEELNLPREIYLKLAKRGEEYEGFYSFDNSQWTSIGKQFLINLDGKPIVGGYNWNQNGRVVADTGIRVDYFEIIAR
jgi:hypothetical protein